MKDTLLEELAELEHDQWVRIRKATFTKAKEIEPGVFLIEKLQAAVWKDMFKPYAELSEELKEYDRIEARKVLEILSRYRPAPSSADEGANLPKGRTCRSCLHTQKCKQLGIYNPDSIVCDWNPCRYAEYHGDMTLEPMFMREVCEALGWQGGTVHDAIKEIHRIKELSLHPSTDKSADHFVDLNKLVKRLREHISDQKLKEADYLGYDEIEAIINEVEKDADGHKPEDVVERVLRHSQAPNTSRPSTQADIVGELKGLILRRSQAAGKNLVCCDIWTKEIEEIIAKAEKGGE